ncbi:hypothetical protein, partial [Mesorhizobium sp.]|uniref:hypothetical protein n=1 Tax=Mesorhizobium sp. TaxID=1871066 RepID=UPI0025C09ECB
ALFLAWACRMVTPKRLRFPNIDIFFSLEDQRRRERSPAAMRWPLNASRLYRVDFARTALRFPDRADPETFACK